MSVEQRVKISCDNFACEAEIANEVGLTYARAASAAAGWVFTISLLGLDRQRVLQDFCPEHREQGFDWDTWQTRGWEQSHPRRLRAARARGRL